MMNKNPSPIRWLVPAAAFATFLALLSIPQAVSALEEYPGLDEALGVIAERVVGFDDIDRATASRKAIEGVLSIVDPGAVIETPSDGESEEAEEETVSDRPIQSHIVEEGFAYIEVPRIDDGTRVELTQLLDSLGEIDGVVLDLRMTAGADLDAAAALSSVFVPEGTLVFSVEGRGGEKKAEYTASNDGKVWPEVPLVIIVGGRTGAAAEALAGGLRDLRRALLVGEPTPGGAVRRESFSLSDGTILRLATQRVRFPSGAVLFPLGAQPDIEIRPEPEVEETAETGEGLEMPPAPERIEMPDVEPEGEEGISPGEPSEETEKDEAELAEEEAVEEILADPAVRVSVDILKGFHALQP